MNDIFNVDMTSSEARVALWNACEGKTKEEREEIKEQYKRVSGIILKREFELYKDCMTSF